MANITYAILTRQAGLRQEMQVVANNLANISTRGFQREGVVFSEFVAATENADNSLSMATAKGRVIDRTQGQLAPTGGQFDFAIEGEGYFLIDTPQGQRLSRAGNFHPGPTGEMVNPDGYLLLDAGGAPVFVPPDTVTLKLGRDGTLSADETPLTQIGLFVPEDMKDLKRDAGLLYEVEGEIIPAEDAVLVQGFLENSNVDPILEVARMIEVQRAYEQGRNLMMADDERLKSTIETLGS
ncbi:MAG: flagellar hook-basal body complex protein [Qingshengfaniella sp.]